MKLSQTSIRSMIALAALVGVSLGIGGMASQRWWVMQESLAAPTAKNSNAEILSLYVGPFGGCVSNELIGGSSGMSCKSSVKGLAQKVACRDDFTHAGCGGSLWKAYPDSKLIGAQAQLAIGLVIGLVVIGLGVLVRLDRTMILNIELHWIIVYASLLAAALYASAPSIFRQSPYASLCFYFVSLPGAGPGEAMVHGAAAAFGLTAALALFVEPKKGAGPTKQWGVLTGLLLAVGLVLSVVALGHNSWMTAQTMLTQSSGKSHVSRRNAGLYNACYTRGTKSHCGPLKEIFTNVECLANDGDDDTSSTSNDDDNKIPSFCSEDDVLKLYPDKHISGARSLALGAFFMQVFAVLVFYGLPLLKSRLSTPYLSLVPSTTLTVCLLILGIACQQTIVTHLITSPFFLDIFIANVDPAAWSVPVEGIGSSAAFAAAATMGMAAGMIAYFGDPIWAQDDPAAEATSEERIGVLSEASSTTTATKYGE